LDESVHGSLVRCEDPATWSKRRLDNDGLGEIGNGFHVTRRGEGTLKLCGATHRIQNLLKVTRLTSVLDVVESEQDAL
jgi:anti-anti-sigma regulatory factor